MVLHRMLNVCILSPNRIYTYIQFNEQIFLIHLIYNINLDKEIE